VSETCSSYSLTYLSIDISSAFPFLSSFSEFFAHIYALNDKDVEL